MLTDLLKWGGKRGDAAGRGGDAPAPRDEPAVASKAFPKFVAAIAQRDAPVLLDLGPVIGSNVAFCGERLGCKLFIEDFLADVDRQLRGKGGDLAASIRPASRTATPASTASCAGICSTSSTSLHHRRWPQQIVRMLRPGGAVMGFFCTTGVERSPFTKFEIVDDHTLRHRYHPGVGGKKQSLQNRDIIKMFDGLVVADSFLLKNNTREMLLRKKA